MDDINTPQLTLYRGHKIEEIDGVFYYVDDGTHVANRRPWCGKCGQKDTPEGHDACLGTIPGVMNACCGHGNDGEAYIQKYASGIRSKS